MALDGSITGLVTGHTCGLIYPIKAGIGGGRRMGNRRVLFSMSRLGSFLISSMISSLVSSMVHSIRRSRGEHKGAGESGVNIHPLIVDIDHDIGLDIANDIANDIAIDIDSGISLDIVADTRETQRGDFHMTPNVSIEGSQVGECRSGWESDSHGQTPS